LETNQSTFIPLGAVHRVGNPDSGPLVVIEVQSGTDLRETDIVRLEDDFGRVGVHAVLGHTQLSTLRDP
jgi:mannose-1-phosphate guanylyltransferase/mannose-6-phosphate isomerase